MLRKNPLPLLIAACAFLMALCAVLCAANAIQYQEAARRYDETAAEYRAAAAELSLKTDKQEPPQEPVEELPEPPLTDVGPLATVQIENGPEEGTAPIAVDFAALQSVNSDVVGWLYCPGTSINFPILETTEREERPGCVFSVTPFLQTSNTVIYGPTAEDGGMFGALLAYREQAFYDDHPEIWLLTPEESHRIHLLGGSEIPTNDPLFTPQGRVEAENEMLRVMEKSTFIADAHLRGHLVTLATSAEESSESRFVVFGLTK